MKQAIYLYQAIPSRGEMLLANDSSSFTLPFFEEAQKILAKITSFGFASDASFYPNGAREDGVMAAARANFRLSEWLFPSLIVDSEDSPSSALLVNRSHLEQVLVIDLRTQEVVACCMNGAEIREEGGEAMSVKEFLSTLSLPLSNDSFSPKKQSKPVNLGYLPEPSEEEGGEEDAPLHIEISRPSFEPASKKGTLDLGSSYGLKMSSEEENEDEPVDIEVKKESFSAGSGKRPKDLGSFSKDKKRRYSLSHSDEEEPDPSPIASSYVRPSFEPNVRRKVTSSSFSSKSKQDQRQTAFAANKKDPEGEPRIAPNYSKPPFEPNSKFKPSSGLASDVPNQRRYSPTGKAKSPATEERQSNADEERVCLFTKRGDAPSSRTIINDPSLMFVAKKFVREGNLRFGVAPKVNASKTEFYAIGEGEKAAFLQKALAPTLATWDLLALNVEPNGMPHSYLLSNKEDQSLCAVYQLNGDVLSLTRLTHNGISVEDPNLDYASLRLLCFPSQSN